MQRIHVRIEGRVQGVGFRAWTVATARKLGVQGWVRNRTDGSVEAVFAGSEAAVSQMLAACNDGPPAAKVTAISTKPYLGDISDGEFLAKETV